MTEQFIIQSDSSNIPVAEERLFHFCQEIHVGRYYSAVGVAMIQALENAIEHGNKGKKEKKVTLTFGTCRGGMYVEVADEGEGFNYAQYGSMPKEEEQGEGIFVMSQLADRLEYSDGGSRIRMDFFVDGIDPAEACERTAVLRCHNIAKATVQQIG